MNILDSLSTAKATGIAVLVWAVALFLAGGAALEARLKADDRTRINLVAATKPSKLVVKEEPATAKEYEHVVKIVQNIHPNIEVTLAGYRRGRRGTGDGVQIKVKDVSAYYTFIMVMYDIMTAIPDARWTFEEMCAGEGCGTVPYSAVLKAKRKKTSLVEGTTTDILTK